MESLAEKDNCSSKSDRRFSLTYIGWSALDRRTTLPMLPWLVAEIRRRSEKGDCGPVVQPREVHLVLNPPFVRCVPSSSTNSSVFIFEHKAQLISRFIHNSNDLTYFAYLLRGQPDNPESQMSCHVFKACDPNQVQQKTITMWKNCNSRATTNTGNADVILLNSLQCTNSFVRYSHTGATSLMKQWITRFYH